MIIDMEVKLMIDLVKANEVEGYEILSEENQQLFTHFLKNFYRVWEHPENFVPISVYVCSEEGKKFLKYVYTDMRTKRKEWLHVVDPDTWY